MGSIRTLWDISKKYYRLVIWNIVFNILSAILSVFSLLMLIPFLQVLFYSEEQLTQPDNLPNFPVMDSLYQYWTNIMLTQGKHTALIVLCASLVFVFFLKNATKYLAAYFLVPVRTGVMRDLRSQIFQKLLSLDFTFYQKKRRGEILTNFGNDVQEVEYGIINFIETGIKEPVTILITLTSLIIMSPYLTMWVVILLPLSALVIGRIGKRLKKDSFKAQYQLSLLQMMVDEVMHGIRVIQSFNNVQGLFKKFHAINQEYRDLHIEMLNRKELASPLSEVLGVLVVAIILFIGGSAILTGNSALSPEVFITYIVVFSQIISPAKAFSNAWYFIQKGIASLDRIQDLLQEQSFYDLKKGTIAKNSFDEKIEILHLNYSFGDKQVLKDINLSIQKGEKIAFVGPSGSGKTTLINLLSRIYDIPDSTISIDGIDINQIQLEDFRSLYSIVTQDPILFFGTVNENLEIASDHQSFEKKIEALSYADALGFVMELPQTIHTYIGERGAYLSIGQQQRLTLARAYLKDAPILILDEVTASLDGVSDQSIKQSIQQISEGKTVISIAHRLSSILDYDQIYFLENGVITGHGTHQELMETHPLYKKMVESQAISS